ncbi:MAG: hypothetical protein LAT57_08050 [Balneolales bacterium]|nr:hypothetical protein [Balneolales bacterium]
MDYEVNASSYCEGGLAIAQDLDLNYSQLTLTHPGADSEDKKGMVIVNNCSTSLQLITTDTISLILSHPTSLANNTVILPDSQLFVLKVADPPRLA